MAETKEIQPKRSAEVGTHAEQQRLYVHPRTAIWSTEGTIVLRLEMPGVRQEDLSIDIENDTLTIQGLKRPIRHEGKWVVKERRDADYRKVFTLDETIDRNSIDAVMENGILTLTLKELESARPRKIQVRKG